MVIGLDGKALRDDASFAGAADAQVQAKILVKARMTADAMVVRNSVLPGVQACGPISARCDQVWRGSEVPGLHRFQLDNEAVNLLEKCSSACVRHACEHRGRMLGNTQLARLACPSPDIAIGNECKTAQIVTPTGMPKVGEQIVEAQSQGKRGIHVAMQHETAS